MPRLDGTGPQGQGPMTGRGMGRCGHGYGMGYGMGYGLGGRRFYTKDEEKDLLEQDVKDLEGDLKAAKERLAEIQDK